MQKNTMWLKFNLQSLRVISILAALLVGFWLPLRLIQFPLPVEYDWGVDILISVVSLVNIYLHFEENQLDYKKMSSWLRFGVVLDFICVLPLLWLEQKIFGYEHRALVLLNLLSARHIWRIKSFLDQFHSLQPVVYRLAPLLLMMPLLVHIVACGWIGLGSGTAGADPDKMFEYIKAIYWSFTTLTTVGYGDISAKTPAQMIYCCFIQVIGVGVFGFVLSNVASLLSRMDAAREHHMDNLDRMETFMRSHSIPSDLKLRVRGYFRHLWKNYRGYNDRSMLSELPTKVQSELLFFINKSITKKVPLFKGASQELLEDLMHELQPRIFVPGEKIFKVNEAGSSMYFIHSGTVEIINSEKKHLATLQEGAFFGEMALIFDQPRSATALAQTYCDLYTLSKESFNKVTSAYPEFKEHIQKVIHERTKNAA